jgi:hypothetical protein
MSFANARPGDFVVDNTDPVFLTVVSKGHRAPDEKETGPQCADVEFRCILYLWDTNKECYIGAGYAFWK